MNKNREWEHTAPMWRQDIHIPDFTALKENAQTEVLVVGAGITGVTTALLLAQAGKQVTLLEAGKILNGTSGHTTAKVTAQHGLIYHELIQHFGLEKASLYYQAQVQAQSLIEKQIHDLNISCDWKIEDACLYSETDEGARELEKEYQAYKQLGIPGSLHDTIDVDIDMTKSLVMNHQASFHPLKYLTALVDELLRLGGQLYEDTEAVDVTEEDTVQVSLANGAVVTCDQLVCCTHFPFYDGKALYFSRMYAERSYLIAIEPEKDCPDGMYLSVDEPKRSIRPAQFNDKPVLLIGGESHRTGEGTDTRFHYRALEEFAAEAFGIKNVLFRWSAQDLTTLDKVPYIGPINRNNKQVFVATGYRKWGMTNGTLAAHINTEYVLGEESLFHSLFKPSRFKADPSMKQFLSQNFNVAAHLVEGKLELVGNRPEALKKGEGGVVQWKGERAGAYKDEDGTLYVLDTTCTHMHCEVEWNSAERTWDCPCHGSRFSFDGTVMEGPAKKPLQEIPFSSTEELTFLPKEDETTGWEETDPS
ncbi:FAD-dependent oxidoreductase [Halobacillus salinarum]|uniref:FAD-dependent oxidoreductase n=1 Tax=Halobacillus salinarum TaxID=2932257 RepID=A0ABY4EM32_9BACI|nr:FAD-dependent oxidoreductase [Halobacillus salinarum]UOQ45229.1 FAD-dependent oxidoreductase [Halobacillus salinarum]